LYLEKLTVSNFRKLKATEFKFTTSQGLKPGRNSQLARLLRLLGDGDKLGRDEIEATLDDFDKKLKATSPIEATQNTIIDRHKTMLGKPISKNRAD